MFLYNILTGGSSKQQLPKYDKISFKINLSDNVPQFYQCTPSQTNKPYQYQEEEQLNPGHPMYGKIMKAIQGKRRKSSSQGTKVVRKSSAQGQQTKEMQGEAKGPNFISEGGHKEQQVKAKENHEEDFHNNNVQEPQQSSEQSQQEQLSPTSPSSPEHPSSSQQYHLYTTTQNDTLFGLALKLDIHQQEIQQLNNISSLYPGMTIKLPFHCDVTKLYELPEEHLSKVKISELLGSERGVHVETEKFAVEYYAGLAGYIKGTLSINNNYIIFNPNLEDQVNLENYSIEKLLKFNAIVETIDIQNIDFIDIPEMGDTESKIENPDHNFIIQIFLYIVGNSKIEKRYKERLDKLKTQKKAIASISFSLRGYKSEAKDKCERIVQKVKDILKNFQNKDREEEQGQKSLSKSRDLKHLTNIPFFDIIHQNLHPRMKEQIQSCVLTPSKSHQDPTSLPQPMSPSLICGILTEPSDIITDTMFHNLSYSLPLLYQQCNWTRIYSSTLNGTSFMTFLNKASGQYPLILLVKEYKGWTFGAYLCESLETGKTGRGEMFLFTFKDQSEVPDTYKWTAKNQFFVYVEKDSGIGIGMGLKYGLFVKNTMDKGSSAATYTFGNTQSLSKKQDFTVEEVQLWTVDNAY